MDTEMHPTIAGKTITIRPIRRTDTDIEANFVRQLSPMAKHYRFLGGVKELSPTELKRFCEVDGKHSMAFVATTTQGGSETQIGVSRYAPNSKSDTREIALTLADDWHGKGLGPLLMKQLIASAIEHGVKRLYAIELIDNAEMRTLADELGMSTQADPDDARQLIYTLML